MAVQKKKSGIPPSQGLVFNRTYEKMGAKRLEGKAANIKPNTQTKKTICTNRSAQITATPRNTAGANGLNVDERLRLVRERREEQQKFLASRELGWLKREQRAKQYHEKQLAERRKKLQEQRLKEERRRAAVEEKRKQRLKEEKERYESAVRKTQEKSRRAQQSHYQNCRGRQLSKNNVPRRLPLTTWEKNLISRLLTPTCSYLARSKSAGCHSGEEVSCNSMNLTTNNTVTIISTLITTGNQKPGHHFSPAQQKSALPIHSNRSINPAQIKPASPQELKKRMLTSKPPTAISTVKPITKPQSRTPSPSPERTCRRSSNRMTTPLQPELPSVPEEELPVCSSALSPSNMRPIRMPAESLKETGDTSPPETPCSNSPAAPTQAETSTKEKEKCSFQSQPPSAPLPPLPEPMNRPLAGTTDPEEASRALAQKRREARLQKEREEQIRLQEEADRKHKEELEVKRVEEKARLQAEAQRLVEEKRRREVEEQRKAEEERALAMKEAALLLKKREEEQEREREKAAQMKREIEIIAHKEEEERQARKKRLEEIMRRTRRADMKSMPERIQPNEVQPKENTEPVYNRTVAEAAKPPQQVLNDMEDMVPVVAFKERRSLRTLTSLEEIQTHQRAEVI